MLVKLTYFKEKGKYYSEGEYDTSKEHMFQIFQEVKEMAREGKRPGLTDCNPGENDFYILIDVPNHPNNHPHLVTLDATS